MVWRLLGEMMSWLLGSSLRGFLGAHLPGSPDLSAPFSAASLWGRCCVLYPSCTSGLLLWSSGGGASGRGCTYQCGWTCSILRSVVFLFLPFFVTMTSRKGSLLSFFSSTAKWILRRVLLVKVWEMTVVCQNHGPRC